MNTEYSISIFEYEIKTGMYKTVIFNRMDESITNLSVKELFLTTIGFTEISMKNKFFIMQVEFTTNKKSKFNIYSIRTNTDDSIEDISDIGPNTLDKGMLIDAIVGCRPTEDFVRNCKDRIIHKCIYPYSDNINNNVVWNYKWSPDTKDRLTKVNTLRLKEIYEKLKS